MACPNFKNGPKSGLRPLGVQAKKDVKFSLSIGREIGANLEAFTPWVKAFTPWVKIIS
jgi:hypothetical protein